MFEDQELIRRIARKDHLAFQMLVERYQALVLRTCRSLLDDPENAEDIAQEVFFQVYKSAEKFRYDSSVSTWLRRIAINRCLNFNRDNRKFRWLTRLEEALENKDRRRNAFRTSGENDPALAFQEAEQKQLIRETIASLPEKQKTMLILNKLEGFSYQEIAEIMNTSVSAVEACLHRARVNLQKKLAARLKKI
ncbi:MAG: sigma-70 family RNA polymerase sigma factor [Clostridiales bacterium]|nr:sigma-70 family RNA polymerase sigma factor [Clostridiales bacterium]